MLGKKECFIQVIKCTFEQVAGTINLLVEFIVKLILHICQHAKCQPLLELQATLSHPRVTEHTSSPLEQKTASM